MLDNKETEKAESIILSTLTCYQISQSWSLCQVAGPSVYLLHHKKTYIIIPDVPQNAPQSDWFTH
jgi:hypothetical protein